jgi:acetylornithine/succinyldiaminopimelate/putrescine aminotransferase
MPLSVVGGKREIMESGQYFISSTFAGETLSLASALKTMTLLQTKYSIDELWQQGDIFRKAFNSFYPEKIRLEGYPTRGSFKGDELTRALFLQEACRAGMLFGPSWFISFKHLPHMDVVTATCQDILGRIKTNQVKLLGEMPITPFATKVRST